MNFLALRDRTRELCSVEGYADMSPPPDYAAAVNQALYSFSWEAEYNEKDLTFTTSANTAVYALPSKVVKYVKELIYDTGAGEGAIALRLSSEAYERAIDPMWRMRPSSTPHSFWVPEPNVVRLYPAPSEGGKVCLAVCVCAEDALSADTDTPSCPEHYHEDIARLAAWFIGQTYATGEARERVLGYRTEAMNHAGDIRAEYAQQHYHHLPRIQRTIRKRRIWI